MDLTVAIVALVLMMVLAYRGISVVLIAPLIAVGAVLVSDPTAVLAAFSGIYMEKFASFFKLYFPVLLLGALFGKVMEASGFVAFLVAFVARVAGLRHTILGVVLSTGLLAYGGVSVFVVVFSAYPFAALLFRRAGLPKRLLPAALVLGAATFAMDAFPGSPQLQNIIPTTFYGTTAWAAPALGALGGTIVATAGLAYLYWRASRLRASGEGYGEGHLNEPASLPIGQARSALLAVSPLAVVCTVNLLLSWWLPSLLGATSEARLPGVHQPIVVQVQAMVGVWAIIGALLLGIIVTAVLAWRTIRQTVAESARAAVVGSLLATANVASEYGFGAVIAVLPGFLIVKSALAAVPDPLLNAGLSTTVLAGITGSASGGMSIVLAAKANDFLSAVQAAGIPPEVLHRVTAMAAGGMDTLPHNGAIITVLLICGLTHRQSYPDILALTFIKTLTAFAIIPLYYATGLA